MGDYDSESEELVEQKSSGEDSIARFIVDAGKTDEHGLVAKLNAFLNDKSNQPEPPTPPKQAVKFDEVAGFVTDADRMSCESTLSGATAYRSTKIKQGIWEQFSAVVHAVGRLNIPQEWYFFHNIAQSRGQRKVAVLCVLHPSMQQVLVNDLKIGDYSFDHAMMHPKSVAVFHLDVLYPHIEAIVRMTQFGPMLAVEDRDDRLPMLWPDFARSLLAKYTEDAVKQVALRKNPDGMVAFADVRNLFRTKSDVLVEIAPRQWAAMHILSEQFKDSGSEHGELCWEGFTLELNDDGQIAQRPHTHTLLGYKGSVAISSLSIRLLDETTKATLQQRGGRVLDLCHGKGFVYCQYDGTYQVHEKLSVTGHDDMQHKCSEYSIKNRVMLDRYQFYMATQGEPKLSTAISTLPAPLNGAIENHLHLMYPYLRGYDMQELQQWGSFHIDHLAPVVYRKDAWARLVMPNDPQSMRKSTIRAVLKHFSPSSSQDMVGHNKNSGRVLLLAGSPGVGKTSTCEAAAELLEQPLYYLTAGSLGTDPKSVESGLKEAMVLAIRWKAIVLLDEADVFLEARDNINLVRNAIVGTFLRALEYFAGILFLTTNRVNNFDHAVVSRIHVAMQFPPLDEASRRAIWKDHVQHEGFSAEHAEIGVEKVAASSGNGRQLRTIYNIARSLAKDDESIDTLTVPFAESHVELALTLNSLHI